MCQFRHCGTETKASWYCTICGREICPDCEDTKNPKKHTTCIRDSESGGKFVPASVLIPGSGPGYIPGPIPGDEAPVPW